MTIRFSTALRQTQATAVITEIGTSGKILIYTGTQPANPGTAASGTLLVTITAAATFGTASAGVITISGTPLTAAAAAGGTAGWFRATKSDGTTGVIDGSAGTSGTDLILNTATISSGGNVSITSGTITVSPD